jgi:hypothetical protein
MLVPGGLRPDVLIPGILLLLGMAAGSTCSAGPADPLGRDDRLFGIALIL